ncbi:hypothetical protein B566_EDAN012257 [Ephemera danica]|nr:hypothetical protein B566_EDAN012257 [Ephemera danica]
MWTLDGWLDAGRLAGRCGILGLIGACGYGAYSYKHRGNMSTSVFLMQLRVTAQGAVVVCLTAGITYSLVRDFLLPKINSSSKNE